MKITSIQFNSLFCEPEKNFKSMEKAIIAAAENEPDVIVLPEMWNTGFFPKEHLKRFCDKDGEKTKKLLGHLAWKFSVNIVGGTVCDYRDGKFYNTCYVFDRTGDCIFTYDKAHLFTPLDEQKFFTRGEKAETFLLDGKKCGVLVCYDLRFPELARTLALDGAEVLFAVAQWPKGRLPQFKILCKSRALENQAYVVCCNGCGVAGDITSAGNSAILAPNGEALTTAGNGDDIITAECDMTVTEKVRTNANIFEDRRPDLYRI